MRQVVPADTQRARGLRSLERNVLEGALALFITDPLRVRARARAQGVSRNFFSSSLLFSPPNPINATSRRARKAKRSKTPRQLTHRPLQRPYLCPDYSSHSYISLQNGHGRPKNELGLNTRKLGDL